MLDKIHSLILADYSTLTTELRSIQCNRKDNDNTVDLVYNFKERFALTRLHQLCSREVNWETYKEVSSVSCPEMRRKGCVLRC